MVICANCHELDRIHLSLSFDWVFRPSIDTAMWERGWTSFDCHWRYSKNLKQFYVNFNSIENWYRDYSELVITWVRLSTCTQFICFENWLHTHTHSLFMKPICTIISDKSFRVQTYNGLGIHLSRVFDSLVFIIWMLCGVIRYRICLLTLLLSVWCLENS